MPGTMPAAAPLAKKRTILSLDTEQSVAAALPGQVSLDARPDKARDVCSDARYRPIWDAPAPLDGPATALVSKGLATIDMRPGLLGGDSFTRAGQPENGFSDGC